MKLKILESLHVSVLTIDISIRYTDFLPVLRANFPEQESLAFKACLYSQDDTFYASLIRYIWRRSALADGKRICKKVEEIEQSSYDYNRRLASLLRLVIEIDGHDNEVEAISEILSEHSVLIDHCSTRIYEYYHRGVSLPLLP